VNVPLAYSPPDNMAIVMPGAEVGLNEEDDDDDGGGGGGSKPSGARFPAPACTPQQEGTDGARTEGGVGTLGPQSGSGVGADRGEPVARWAESRGVDLPGDARGATCATAPTSSTGVKEPEAVAETAAAAAARGLASAGRDVSAPRRALTQFRLLARLPGCDQSLVECRPLTGRTHQIRIHLQVGVGV
jgi:hypothetical protein